MNTYEIPPYSKPRTYGDKFLRDLHKNPVVIQEKIDGSQFSFYKDPETGDLLFKTRNKMITPETCEAQFRPTVEHLLANKDAIIPGWIYRGEAMSSARHNKLKYDRAPSGHLVLYDIQTEDGLITDHGMLVREADGIGVEPVNKFGHLMADESMDEETFNVLMSYGSKLGGTCEGVVLKNYHRKDPADETKVLMAKIVSAEFREKKTSSMPKNTLNLDSIIDTYRTEARWDKAVQHLRDSGYLEGTPKDIGPIMAEVQRDVEEEEKENIKDLLYAKFRKSILKGVSEGVAQWYKDGLAVAGEPQRADLVSPEGQDA